MEGEWDMGVTATSTGEREGLGQPGERRVTSGMSDCHQLAKKGDRIYRSRGVQLAAGNLSYLKKQIQYMRRCQ